MKKVLVLIVSGLLWLSASVNAEDIDPKMRAALDEMSELTNMASVLDGVWGQLNTYQNQLLKDLNVPEEKQKIAKQKIDQMTQLFQQELSWGKMKESFYKIYARVYTLEDIQAINKFYSSSAGKKMTAKTPELMQETMTMMQNVMVELMPKIKAITEELKEEVASNDMTK